MLLIRDIHCLFCYDRIKSRENASRFDKMHLQQSVLEILPNISYSKLGKRFVIFK